MAIFKPLLYASVIYIKPIKLTLDTFACYPLKHSMQVLCVGQLTDDSRSDTEDSGIENNLDNLSEGEGVQDDSEKKNS